MKKCLYNTYSNNVAGYCKLHHCNLTVTQIKCRKCLGKECHHLEKDFKHDWWRQREQEKQRRKERKKMRGF